jgi:uncharacterized protein YfaS (alpha-2-macroglobulin family)
VNAKGLRFVVLAAVLCSGCGQGSGGPQRHADGDEARLFGSLEAPALEERTAPRLVLRDGPSVPSTRSVLELGPPAAPPAAPPSGPVEPLYVVSWAPYGAADLVGAVRVTFSQPMVPVAELSATSVERAPLQLTPLPPGRFRWLGTTTLAFEPIGRMPSATHYTATVPAGTTSAVGGRLATAVTFALDTPAPAIEATFPYASATSIGRDTLVGILFNQRVDPVAIARVARLEGAHAPALVLLTGAELARAKEQVPGLQGWDEERSIVLRPAAPLAAGTDYTLRVPAGALGAEGPRPMERDASVSFRTFDPLRLVDATCGYEGCTPDSIIALRFNSDLANQDLEARVTVRPEVPRLELQSTGGSLRISGDLAARTRYTVTVSADLEDVFGQRLGHTETRAFSVGDASPRATLGVDTCATLELAAPRSLPVTLLNVPRVGLRIAAVPRAKLGAAIVAAESGRSWYRDEDPFANAQLTPTQSSLSTLVPRNQQARLGIPLGAALPVERSGYALVEVDIPGDEGRDSYETVLVTATDLGIVVTADSFATTVRVTSLSTGAPVEGATVEALWTPTSRPSNAGPLPPPLPSAVTDARGVARILGLPPAGYVVATKGSDQAFARVSGFGAAEDLVGSVYSDRSPYRPGDTAHLRAVARRRASSPAGELRSVAGEWMVCLVSDGDSTQSGRFEGRLSPYGTLAEDFVIPAGGATGGWHVICRIGSDDTVTVRGEFQVQEYRAPELEVAVTAPTGEHFVADTPTLEVASTYLFGAPAASLPVRYTVAREGTRWRPDGHDGYEFGLSVPWHTVAVTASARGSSPMERWAGHRELVSAGEGMLDAAGRLRVPVPLDPGAFDGPLKFVLEAAVTDASRQEVAGRVEVIAHPASVYVGLHLDQPFLRERDPIRVKAIAAAVDGTLTLGKRIELHAFERRSRLVAVPRGGGFDFRWEETDREVGECTVTSAATAAECQIAPQRAGLYVLEASAEDEHHRAAKTTTTVWVAGSSWVPSEEPSIQLLPEKTHVAAGETARILVRAPFAHGRGLVAVERVGALEVRPFDLEGSVGVVEVPVPEAGIPELTVRVSLARGRASRAELAELLASAGPDALAAAEDDVGRPLFATTSTTLWVSDAPKRLAVTVRPDRATHAPGERMSVDIEVREPGGRPADAEVAVMAVDEGVLSLLGFETPEPVDQLFPTHWYSAGAWSVGSQDSLIAQQPLRMIGGGGADSGESNGWGGLGLRGMGRGGGGTGEGTIGMGSLGTIGHGGGGGGGSREATRSRRSGGLGEIPTSARTLFATTAFYTGAVRTDRDGNARVRFELPGNLTTFRIMAVAIGRDDHSGSGDAKVQVRKRLLLRPALPRFATLGDRFEAQVVVHNETGAAADISVGVRVAGLELDGARLRRVHLANGEAKRVTFPVRVVAGRGIARVQFAASAPNASDAVDAPIPLIEPATSEAFSTYGSLERGVVRIPVRVPRNSHPEFGRLELTLGATALTNLDDAADWLLDYPYENGEQLASKLIAAAALADLLDGRSIAGRARAREFAAECVVKLQRLRLGPGIRSWPEDNWPGLDTTAWATLALVRAKAAGIAVPDEQLASALHGLGELMRSEMGRSGYVSGGVALALYTLAEAGSQVPDSDVVLARVSESGVGGSLDAEAWLAVALAKFRPGSPSIAERLRVLRNSAVESAGTASFGMERVESDRPLWHSESRTDAIVLGTLLRLDASSPLVEKVVRGLLAGRHDGRWETTQENAWALDSLARYWRARESVAPSLDAQAWLGTRYLGATHFEGRAATVSEGVVPMGELRRLGDSALVISERGRGRLYYRVGLRYAPASLRMSPEEQGFSVTRSYESIAAPADVRRAADGTWHVKAGADVRVRLTVVVPAERSDVAIDDPLPAGLEPVNLTFRTTASQRLSQALDERVRDTGDYWALFAFDHRELRDERMVAFAGRVSAGVYELTYLARATTPGTFLAQPTHAEEIYAPETFGRTATDVLVVDP